MVFLIIVIIGLLGGIVLAITDDEEWIGCALLSGIIFICMMAAIISKPYKYKQFKIQYDVLSEMITSKDDIRDATFTNNLIEINAEIKYAKEFRDNVWIGIFIPHKKADLELLNK